MRLNFLASLLYSLVSDIDEILCTSLKNVSFGFDKVLDI